MRGAAFVFLLAMGCSSSDPPPPFCASDPRVETFTPGLQSKGVQGVTAAIVTALPVPVQQGINDWSVRLDDAAGRPLTGATIVVKPIMPDHGHGSPTQASVAENAGGQYSITGINLSMRGVWVVTLVVTTAAISDEVSFTFCVDGTS